MRYFDTTALLILIASFPAPATSADIELISKVRSTAPAVDQIFKEYAAENHLPGLSYGIIAGGELVYSGSFGYSNLEEKIPASSS